MERMMMSVLVIGALSASAWAQYSFEVLPSTPQTANGMQAWGVSDDGNTVVGAGVTNGSFTTPFVWRRGVGSSGLPLPFANHTYAFGVSGDGRYVTGETGPTPTTYAAVRWSLDSNLFELAPTTDSSSGYAISGDGRYVVGFSGLLPMRWDTFGGNINALSDGVNYLNGQAFDVSPDGSAATGGLTSRDAGSSSPAFRWTQAGGLEILPDVPGSPYSVGRAISADAGSIAVVANFFGDPNAPSTFRAFRWTSSGGYTDLGTLHGSSYSDPQDISADGSTIVGSSGGSAFIWTQTQGLRDLNEVLASLGVDLNGRRLNQALAITPDGRTIVGDGSDEAGNTFAWIATIPAPSTPAFVSLGLVALRRRR